MTDLRKKLLAGGAVAGLMFAGATTPAFADEEAELEVTVTVAVDVEAEGVPDAPTIRR